MNKPYYYRCIENYEKMLEKHGACYKALLWPNQQDLEKRFNVIFDPIKVNESKISILDVGCGYGEMITYLNKKDMINNIIYTGIDISKKMIKEAQKTHPKSNFLVHDIIQSPFNKTPYDYVILNGLLTSTQWLNKEDCLQFAHEIISNCFISCKQAVIFNAMSKHVDWERNDLFHWSFDECTTFLKERCSRHITIRADYNLYEYMVYLYKEPTC